MAPNPVDPLLSARRRLANLRNLYRGLNGRMTIERKENLEMRIEEYERLVAFYIAQGR